MASGRELPPAEDVRPEKKRRAQMVAAAAVIGVAAVSIAILLLLAGVSAFGWNSGDHASSSGMRPGIAPGQATEEAYTGTWQGYSEDGKRQVINFTADNRFRHWTADSASMHEYDGDWRYDSSLYIYRLVYDRGDYSASVKINPAIAGEVKTMHFEPLSSAPGMPLRGLDLEKVEASPAAPEY